MRNHSICQHRVAALMDEAKFDSYCLCSLKCNTETQKDHDRGSLNMLKKTKTELLLQWQHKALDSSAFLYFFSHSCLFIQ